MQVAIDVSCFSANFSAATDERYTLPVLLLCRFLFPRLSILTSLGVGYLRDEAHRVSSLCS
jgi:hypothetical protein